MPLPEWNKSSSCTSPRTLPAAHREKETFLKSKIIGSHLKRCSGRFIRIKRSFEEFKANPNKKPQIQPRPSRGCESCVAKHKSEECTHCFICGDSSHFAYGCRKRSVSKIGQGLWPRRGNPQLKLLKHSTSHFCLKEETIDKPFGTCKQCKTVFHCSKLCQKRDWQKHGPLCEIIAMSEQEQANKVKIEIGDSHDNLLRPSHLSDKNYQKYC